MSKFLKREIGSEFDYPQEYLYEPELPILSRGVFTYSGRTAIYLIVKELLLSREIRKAWFPSYCCESMIRPVCDLGIAVDFYKVDCDKRGFLVREDFAATKQDIVFTLGYFGFSDEGNHKMVQRCQKDGIIVIEDCTHSLLSVYDMESDYQIASLRKWFPIASGGIATMKHGVIISLLDEPDIRQIQMRIDAMQEKRAYLSGNDDALMKREFLEKYREFNKSFSKHYDWEMDSWSYTVLMRQKVDEIRKRRRSNAEFLLKGLRDIMEVKPLFSELCGTDCPLFVPIRTADRDELQTYLANVGIYCPAHWPRHHVAAKSSLYDEELSLICDQRYTEEDMSRILEEISRFYKEKK